MARIDSLPSLEVIKGFKGVIDFVVTRGVPYARSWPRTPRSHLTQATLQSAALFGEVLKAYRLQHPLVIEALRLEAQGQPVSPRDIYVRGVYGNLHTRE